MKQVDFYLISNRVNNAKYKLASRLANKLLRLSQKALLVTESPQATTELDKVMWSFSDTSFLAHEIIGDTIHEAGANTGAPSLIQVGEQTSVNASVLDRGYDVLINLSAEIPEFNQHFSRIAEIVEAEEEAKVAARQRYKAYQAQGFELKTHNIEL